MVKSACGPYYLVLYGHIKKFVSWTTNSFIYIHKHSNVCVLYYGHTCFVCGVEKSVYLLEQLWIGCINSWVCWEIHYILILLVRHLLFHFSSSDWMLTEPEYKGTLKYIHTLSLTITAAINCTRKYYNLSAS